MAARAGKVVTIGQTPTDKFRFTKTERRCEACSGTGMQPNAVITVPAPICWACNGRGSVREWKEKQP